MPKLDFAILAEHVRIDKGVAHVIAAGWDGIQISKLPWNVHISLLMKIRFHRTECGRPHRVEVLVQDEDGNRLAQITNTMRPHWPEGYPITWRWSEQYALDFPVSLKRYGLYECLILVNDSLLKTIQFIVKDPPEPSVGDK